MILLKGILPKKYYDHWCLFSLSMILLTQHQIHQDLLPLIENNLTKFVKETEELYGSIHIRINLHQQLHLIEKDIKLWGLLWTHNSFIYESMNGILVRFIHGTKAIPRAAMYALSCMQVKFKITFIILILL